MTHSSQTPLLDQVHTPDDVRRLDPSLLRQLADELRQETINAVAVTGGHLGAGLGVVELTVALHHVFDTPRGTVALTLPGLPLPLFGLRVGSRMARMLWCVGI